MTYLPPLNGGRINATIGGNTAGASTLVSSGTLTLAGGNNITLSQNGNAITISGGAAGGANTLGMSNLGNTSGTTGVINGSALQFALAGGNNVTLSQSINASSATITISAANQSAQTQDRFNLTLSGNTTGTLAQVSSGTLTLAGGNNITLSQNGNAVTVSAASQTNQSIGLYALGNTTQNSSTTLDARTLSFNGLGGATVGYSNGSIQISAPQTAAQTNQTLGLYAIGNTTQNSSTTLDARTLSFNGLGAATVGYSNGSIQLSVPTQTAQTQSNIQAVYDGANSISTGTIRFSNSNGVSFGINGQTLTASHNGITTQTNQTLGLYAVGNSTQSSSTTLDARTLSFQGAGVASVGYSNGSVIISAPAAAASPVNFSAGTTSNNLGSVVFSNSNGVSFGLNGSTITASAAAGGVALANSQTTYTSGTANLIEGGGAITIASTTGQSFKLSVPQTSSLSATGAVSISTNGSTISIGAPTNATVSRYIYPNEYMPLNTIGATNNTVSFNYVSLDQNISASQFRALFSVSANTHTSASTNTYALTAQVGVYTRNASTISQASSGSQTWSGTYSTNSTGSVQGIRELTMPINMAMTPGEYWFGFVISSSSSNASVGYSQYVVSNQQTAQLTPGRFGAATNTSQLLNPWHGLYNTTTSALPSSAGLTDIVGTGTKASAANFWFDVRNYTVL